MRVTYLLGAGASLPTLPTISEMPSRLRLLGENLESTLKNNFGLDEKSFPKEFQEFAELISKELVDLSKIAEEHSSIDTYAKKLFIKNDVKKLNSLKVTLSIYFSLEALLKKGKVGIRYDNFWASILHNNNENIEVNLKIVTWNYDDHLETSFLEYSTQDNINSIPYILGLRDGFGGLIYTPDDRFSIFKMNGTGTYIRFDEERRLYRHLFPNYKEGLSPGNYKILIDFIKESKLHIAFSQKIDPTITYAWEALGAKKSRKPYIEEVAKEIAKTDILVVIGYSFPFFNREVDRLLFKDLNLKKIYVQDPNFESVVGSMKSIFGDAISSKKIEIEPVSTNNFQFFIPPEL